MHACVCVCVCECVVRIHAKSYAFMCHQSQHFCVHISAQEISRTPYQRWAFSGSCFEAFLYWQVLLRRYEALGVCTGIVCVYFVRNVAQFYGNPNALSCIRKTLLRSYRALLCMCDKNYHISTAVFQSEAGISYGFSTCTNCGGTTKVNIKLILD